MKCANTLLQFKQEDRLVKAIFIGYKKSIKNTRTVSSQDAP